DRQQRTIRAILAAKQERIPESAGGCRAGPGRARPHPRRRTVGRVRAYERPGDQCEDFGRGGSQDERWVSDSRTLCESLSGTGTKPESLLLYRNGTEGAPSLSGRPGWDGPPTGPTRDRYL